MGGKPTQADAASGQGKGWLSTIFQEVVNLPSEAMHKIADYVVDGVTHNSGLTGQASEALTNHNKDIDAAIDEATGAKPASVPPPKMGG